MSRHILPVLTFVVAVLVAGYVGYRVGVASNTIPNFDKGCYVTRIPAGASIVAMDEDCIRTLVDWKATFNDNTKGD